MGIVPPAIESNNNNNNTNLSNNNHSSELGSMSGEFQQILLIHNYYQKIHGNLKKRKNSHAKKKHAPRQYYSFVPVDCYPHQSRAALAIFISRYLCIDIITVCKHTLRTTCIDKCTEEILNESKLIIAASHNTILHFWLFN